MRRDRTLLVLALAANGMITGATLDQGIKQLPARHHIGVGAYTEYSQAADLGNGVAWYAGLGVGTALLTLITVLVGLRKRPSRRARMALWVAGLGTVGHMAVTAFAAPLNFSQRNTHDEASLADIFDSFERLNALRAALMVVTLAAVAVALLALPREATHGPSGTASRTGQADDTDVEVAG